MRNGEKHIHVFFVRFSLFLCAKGGELIKREQNKNGGRNMKNSNDERSSIDVIKDADGNKIVMINDIRFKGKRRVDWDDVKEYLKQFVGEVYEIAETEDLIYIGGDLPDEYTGSEYTKSLRGTRAKAKANATQGIHQMIEIAIAKRYQENKSRKHLKNAKYGWYRYNTRFGLPIYDEEGEIERYNIFKAVLLIRHDKSKKMFLYDILNIKKETSNPFQS